MPAPIGDESIAIRDIAEAIGPHLGVPAKSVTPEEAGGHLGWIAPFFQFDCAAASDKTQRQFNWSPTQPGLLAELDRVIQFLS